MTRTAWQAAHPVHSLQLRQGGRRQHPCIRHQSAQPHVVHVVVGVRDGQPLKEAGCQACGCHVSHPGTVELQQSTQQLECIPAAAGKQVEAGGSGPQAIENNNGCKMQR